MDGRHYSLVPSTGNITQYLHEIEGAATVQTRCWFLCVCVCVCARVCVIKHVINLVDMNKTKSKTNGILVQFITIATNVHPTEAVMDQ